MLWKVKRKTENDLDTQARPKNILMLLHSNDKPSGIFQQKNATLFSHFFIWIIIIIN